MTVTVPASDTQGTILQSAVTQLQNLVNAATNPAVQTQLIIALDAAQQQLVSYLMANATRRAPQAGQIGVGAVSFLTASGILSNGTVNT